MHSRRLLFLLFMFFVVTACAQQETSNWYYDNQGISFNSGAPQLITNIPTDLGFGDITTVCSSADGKLNFIYTSGTIYNRNYQVMAGLTAAPASYLGTPLWAKYPGSDNIYYVFYPTQSATASEATYLRYAVVDMSLNRGLGEVVSVDNIADSTLSVGFCLINKKGTDEFWIVSNKLRTNNFSARPVTATGVSKKAVISIAGLSRKKNFYYFTTMKASFNGEMFAGTTYNKIGGLFPTDYSNMEVFNFNQETGAITNKITTTAVNGHQYLEFSPDNKLLYACSVTSATGLQPCGFASSIIFQYNLCYNDSADFTRLRSVMGERTIFCYYPVWGNLSTAPTKEIYVRFSGGVMSIIRHPNIIGTSASFKEDVYSPGAAFGQSLPNFYQHEIEKPVKNNITYSGGCYPQPLNFAVTNDAITNIKWNFGDPGSGRANTSTAVNPAHVFSKPGYYYVSAALYNSDNRIIEKLFDSVEIKDPLKRLLYNYPKDTSFCNGNKLHVSLAAINGIFEWSYQYGAGETGFLAVSDSMDLNYTGKYFVRLRQNGCDSCSIIDSINITVKPMPFLSIADQTLCGGDSVQIGVYDYDNDINCVWSTGELTDSIWIKNAGQYRVRAEIANNGCPVYDTVTAVVSPAVTFSLPADTTLCEGETLLLKPGTTGAQYTWQDGTSDTSYQVIQPGLYWVQVSSNGCTKTDSINVSYVTTQQVNLGTDTALCQGSSLLLNAGVAGAQYAWSTGSTRDTITVSASGEYWVQVKKNGCSASDTIAVTFHPIPYFSLGSDTTLCEGSALQLTPAVTADNYTWQDNTGTSYYTINMAGTYWLQVSKDQCVFRDSINVSYGAAPLVNIGADTSLCTGTPMVLNAYQPGVKLYAWQDGSTNANFTAYPPGLFYVEVTGANGCKKSDSVVLKEILYPAFSLGNDTAICSGQSLQLQTAVVPAYLYQWSTGVMTNVITVTGAGAYWLEVNNNGCKKRDSINVLSKATPIVHFGSDTLLCDNEKLLLDATNNGANYLWQDGSTLSNLLVTSAGSYSVTVNSSGCTASDTISISYNFTPSFSLGQDRQICAGTPILLDAGITGQNYIWQDGSTSPTLLVRQPGLYILKVYNHCGTTIDSVDIKEGICNMYIPTSFTPNNDNLNDIFRVNFSDVTSYFDLQIYNRYGQLVFESADKQKGWDGKLNGQDQPAGAYIWVLKYAVHNNSATSLNGTVLLLR